MSVKLLKIDGKYEAYGEKEFLLDTAEDVKKLPRYGITGSFTDTESVINEPCEIGSVAIICKPMSIYILSPNNEWTELNNANTIKSINIVNDELIITYYDDSKINLGNIKGESPIKGIDYFTATDITELKQYFETGQLVPTYWEEPITIAEEKVKQLHSNGGIDAVSFVAIADPHCLSVMDKNNTHKAYPLNLGVVSKRLMSDLNIPYLAVLGDLSADCGGNSIPFPTDKNIKSYFEHIVNPVGAEKVLSVLGNHDGTTLLPDADGKYGNNDKTISKTQRFDWFMRPFNDDHNRVWGGMEYFYVDVPQNKVRFIILSCNNLDYTVDSDYIPTPNVYRNPTYDYKQLVWLAEHALNLPNKGEDWATVILTHYPSNGDSIADTPINSDILFNILTSFKNKATCNITMDGEEYTFDYADNMSDLCGIFAGHTHTDSIDYSKGLSVVTVPAAGGSANFDCWTPSTDKETSFDIITINKKERKIYLTRLGVGNDRTVTY